MITLEILKTKILWINPIRKGSTAVVYFGRYEDKVYVKKAFRKDTSWPNGGTIEDAFAREVDILKTLKGLPHFPFILVADNEEMVIYMSYCGQTLAQRKDIPNDWSVQITEISDTLKEKSIIYGDCNLNGKNVCILSDIVYLIDFGSSFIKDKHIPSTQWLEHIGVVYSKNVNYLCNALKKIFENTDNVEVDNENS